MDPSSSLPEPAGLDAVIEKYRAAAAAGQAPDREGLIHEHPALAESLRQFFRRFDLERAAIDRTDADRFAATWTTVDCTNGDGGEATPGLVINDRYELIESLGAGGMGTVWLAEQLSPVKRQVAVKLIKSGMDSRQVLARFDAERQALAVMDHPGIAKVFDGGMNAAGRPFFVMEYVPGAPLPHFCDRERLNVQDRLRLLIDVCSAVQHAHQKGIIHRDLKPSNILAQLVEGVPAVKVIDFGLAKAIHRPLTEQSLHTEQGAMVGTPLYMSPEQAARHPFDVDTRSDIYSLGVVLYELLTGTTPIERQRLQQTSPWELPRLILETEPRPPSVHLAEQAELSQVAARRRCEPRDLIREVAGELDWIVLKALEKDRNRRYGTAVELARDLERFLNEEPVEACPPSKTYRLKKLIRKHRGKFLTGAAGVGLLVAAVVGTSWGWLRSESFRRNAEDSLRIKAEAEASLLRNVRESTDDVVENLIGSRPVLGPQERAYLERSLARWQVFAARQGDDRLNRMYRAEGHRNLGFLWYRLGRHDEAFAAYQTARELIAPLSAAEPDNRDHRWNLSIILLNLGSLQYERGAFAAALRSFDESRRLTQHLLQSDPGDQDAQRNLAAAHNNLGRLLRDLGDAEPALREFQQAREIQLELVRRHPSAPEYREDLSFSRLNLAELQLRLGAANVAKQELDAAHALHSQLAQEFPESAGYRAAAARSLHLTAQWMSDRGDAAAARKMLTEVCDARRRLVSEWPAVLDYRRELAQGLNDLAVASLEIGETDRAQRLLEESRELLTALVRESPHTHLARTELATCYNNLGGSLMRLDNLDAARAAFEQAIGLQRLLVGEYPQAAGFREALGGTCTNLADVLRFQGEPQSSLPLYQEAIALLASGPARSRPADQFRRTLLLSTFRGRAATWRELGNHARAASDWEQCLPLAPELVRHLFQVELADARLRSGAVDAAISDVDELVRRAESGSDGPNLSLDNWYHLACLYSLASREHADGGRCRTEALRLLRYVASQGYLTAARKDHLADDADLDPLRDLPEFKALISPPPESAP